MSPVFNSLGIAKPPRETRVVAAMSGGVDSSVVAGLLKREGYDVVGVTLQLYDHGRAVKKKGACCAGQDIHDAKRVAEQLAFPHYVLDYEERFRRAVMEDFAASYARGETPIPCVRCNEKIKFGDLLALARLKPYAAEPGDIVDIGGRVLGRHPGIIYFPVGQRKGLGLAGNEEPLFVVRLDTAARRVVVGPRESLRTRKIRLGFVNWLS